jgi:ABC-2 type transport system permease protein
MSGTGLAVHPPGPVTRPCSRVYGVLLRDLYTLRRNPPQVVEIIFWPTLELVTWGCVTLFLQAHEVPGVVTGLLGAVLLWQLICRPQGDLARSFLEDVWARNLLNVYVTPVTTGEYVAGMILSGAVRVLAGVGLLASLAFVLFGFDVFALGPALVPYLALLIVMAWSLGLYAIAMVVRYGRSAQAFAWLLAFAFQPFCAVFYPLAVLPGPAQAMARLVPASYVFENMRAVLAGAPPSWPGLAAAALLDAAYLAGAVLCLRGALRHARSSGRLSRFA